MWEIGNKVRDGKADLQEFRGALKIYYKLMLQGIELHRQAALSPVAILRERINKYGITKIHSEVLDE